MGHDDDIATFLISSCSLACNLASPFRPRHSFSRFSRLHKHWP